MDKIFRIVVADDDVDDQEIINQAFTDSKRKVLITVAYDGIQLMDYLLKRERFKNNTDGLPNLILLDLNMPLMDGLEALKQIRSIPRLNEVPVYVITTSRSVTDKNRALELGATGFYNKGASSKDLRRIVKEVCLDCFQ